MDENEFEIEPIPGLPAKPPKDEALLWQGAPAVWPVARDVLRIYWIMGYFGLLCAIRIIALPEKSIDAIVALVIPFVVMMVALSAIIFVTAIIIKRTTVYTITTKRVAMRIGAMVNVTLNLPFAKIGSADLDMRRDGSGSIILGLMGETRLSYLMCWPHVRPFQFSRTQPALRAIPNAKSVAEVLSNAAEKRVEEIHNERVQNQTMVPAE